MGRFEGLPEYERLADWVRAAKVGFFKLDAGGHIVECSEAAAKLLHAEKGQIVGRNFWQFVHPEELDDMPDRARELVAGSGLFTERRLKRSDGKYVTCELAVIREGGSALWLGVRSVERRKMLELRLNLAERFASLGVISESIANAVSNPLSVILLDIASIAGQVSDLQARLNRAWMLLSSKLGRDEATRILSWEGDEEEERKAKTLRDLLADTREAATRLENISRTVVDMAGWKEQQDDAELNSAVERAVRLFQKKLVYFAEIKRRYGRVPRVRIKPSSLVHIVIDLFEYIVSAIERCGRRGEIVIETRQEGKVVLLSVKARGVQIEREEMDKLFEPIHHSATDESGVPPGFGLFVARKLAEEAGGFVRLVQLGDSEIEFILDLQSLARTESESCRTDSLCSTKRSKPRVLVVDDEPSVGKAIQRTLCARCEVVFVDSAERAIELLERDDDFDIVLCDIIMPGMDGIALNDWILRKKPELADCFVFITGGVVSARTKDLLRKRSSLLLEKPFDPDGLRDVIFGLLGLGDSGGPSS